MINATATAVTASLYAVRREPPDPKLEYLKPDPTPSKPMAAAGDVPNEMALGVYTNPTVATGAPGQADEPSAYGNGRREYNDAVTELRRLAMLKASTSYAQAGAYQAPPTRPVVNAAV